MKPVKQTGNATGGPPQKIEKPLDKPKKQYAVRDTAPQDGFHEEPLDETLMDNSGDLSKRWTG